MFINYTRQKLNALKIKSANVKNPYYANWKAYRNLHKVYKKGESIHYFDEGLVLSNPDKFGLIEIANRPSFVSDWYCNHYNETYSPCVFVCRSSFKNKLFVFAGYLDEEAESYILNKPYLESYELSDNSYTDMQSLDSFDYYGVWRYADSFTEREAENSRECYAKDSAEQDIENAKTEIHELNKQALELIKEIKGKEYAKPVCDAIKSRLMDLLNERKQAFKLIKERQDNFWSAVSY